MLKKKIVIIPVIICFILIICAVGIKNYFQYRTVMEGYYLRSDEFSLFIEMNGEPILMKTHNDKMFSGLENGDKILVISDEGIDDSYPGETGVYFCIRLEKGTMENIPEATIEELTEMGYI